MPMIPKHQMSEEDIKLHYTIGNSYFGELSKASYNRGQLEI